MKSMSEQLSPLLKQRGQKRKVPKEPIKPPSVWVEDGLDHINILEQGKTELGAFLAHNALYSFNHSIFGKFKTMSSFWYYIQSVERDDTIRGKHGKGLKNYVEHLTMQYIPNFKAIIMDSNYQKIMQYPFAVKLMLASELPFDCYYINDAGIRIRPPYFKWLLKGFEEIRTAMKSGVYPTFLSFKDVKDKDVYFAVTPELPQITEQEISDRLLQYLEQTA